MRKHIHRAYFLVLLLSACAQQTDKPPPDQTPLFVAPIAPQAATPAGEPQPLAFFDSDAFDTSLATALSSGAKDVHITFAGTTSVNQMPPRINAWLTEVKKSDGQVVAKDPTGAGGDSRGLLGLGMISDLIDLVTWYNERKEREAQLATVNNYNATILYDYHTGALKELVFEQR